MYSGFKDLNVWKLGMEIVEDVYNLSKRLPVEEKYGIVSQMKRAAVSIPSNIAEGHSRNYIKVFIQFLRTSLGSVSELNTLILLTVNLKMINKTEIVLLEDKIDHISKMISKLIFNKESELKLNQGFEKRETKNDN